MIKAVFFDLYGTLAGFKPSRHELQAQACADFDLEVTPKGILLGYAAADAYMSEQNAISPVRLRDSREQDKFFANYERLVLRGDGIDVKDTLALKIFRRLNRVPYELSTFDDVVPTLQALRRLSLRLGLISNIARDIVKLTKNLGLTCLLDITVTSTEIGVEKPHPKIFRAALAKVGANPEEALHVGDQPSSDVDGALGTGIRPVLIDRDGTHKYFDRCSRIENMNVLPRLVRRWNQAC